MLRTTLGLSFILVLGAACSSKSAGDNNGSGGTGTIVGGSGTTATAGSGTSAGSGQGGTSSGGGVTNTGGTRSAGGTPAAGGTTGACADTTLTCVDATQAKICNTMTGVVETFSCVDEAASQGFVATGCGDDPDNPGEETCLVTGVTDTACRDGAQAFGHCEGATDEQLFNIYVNCFQDFMDAHTIVPCFSQYVTPDKMTANDCLRAEEACFPGAGGAGNGAGGSP